MADIVDDFLARLKLHIPDATADRLVALEVEFRQQWGGCDRLYVAKRPGLLKQTRLGSALARGDNIETAFASAGVSRRHGYRILAKPAR